MVDKVNLIDCEHPNVLELVKLVDRFTRTLHAGTHQKAQAVDVAKIGPMGGMILMAIAELQPVAAHDLTAHVSRDKSQMTRLIGVLDQNGFISRSRSASDGRVTVLALTKEGQQQVAAFQDVLGSVLSDMLTPLNKQEQGELLRLLLKIVG